MLSSQELINEQKSYINNKNILIEVSNNLKLSIDKLDILLEEENNAYKIDDVSATGSFLSDLRESENNIYKNLINNVIPSIESKIDSLKYDIIDAKEQEAMLGSEGV